MAGWKFGNKQKEEKNENRIDKRDFWRYTDRDRVVHLRSIMPKGIAMRKVRASQGRITDNIRRRRLPGKCNRNRPPGFPGKDGKAR